MARFLITETVEYLIDDPEIETEDEAESVFLNSENPDDYFVAVTDRTVEDADA
jgi:hypothetical protein